MAVITAILAGLAAGVLSGWGIGGGTLLLVYLTLTGMEPTAARGINLLFFLPCALGAALRYRRAGLIRPRLWGWALLGALPAAAAGAGLSGVLPVEWLRKGFGTLLLLLGARELLGKKEDRK